MKQTILFLSFLFSFATGFSSPSAITTCSSPENVTVTANSSHTISFDWDDCSGCTNTEYRVFYVKDGNTSPEYSTNSSDFIFTNLAPGAFDFYFYRVCGAEQSAAIIITDIVEQ